MLLSTHMGVDLNVFERLLAVSMLYSMDCSTLF